MLPKIALNFGLRKFKKFSKKKVVSHDWRKLHTVFWWYQVIFIEIFNFEVFFYLVTKTSNQVLTLDPGGSGGETYIKWKAWASSFRKNWSERESSWEWWWNPAFKFLKMFKVLLDGTTCLKDVHFDFHFMFLHKKVSVIQKYFTYWLELNFYDSNPWCCLTFG